MIGSNKRYRLCVRHNEYIPKPGIVFHSSDKLSDLSEDVRYIVHVAKPVSWVVVDSVKGVEVDHDTVMRCCNI